jgi:hypothetical protein
MVEHPVWFPIEGNLGTGGRQVVCLRPTSRDWMGGEHRSAHLAAGQFASHGLQHLVFRIGG